MDKIILVLVGSFILLFTLQHSKLTEEVKGSVDENSIVRDNTIERIESYRENTQLTVSDSKSEDPFDQAFLQANISSREREKEESLFEITSYDPRLAAPSNGETYNLIFTYHSIFDNDCSIDKTVSMEEISDFKIRRLENGTRFYCEPSFFIKEKLFLIGALKDMRTVFLLGFLFDYEKI